MDMPNQLRSLRYIINYQIQKILNTTARRSAILNTSNNLENKIPPYWRVKPVCLKVQTYPSSEPLKEYNQGVIQVKGDLITKFGICEFGGSQTLSCTILLAQNGRLCYCFELKCYRALLERMKPSFDPPDLDLYKLIWVAWKAEQFLLGVLLPLIAPPYPDLWLYTRLTTLRKIESTPNIIFLYRSLTIRIRYLWQISVGYDLLNQLGSYMNIKVKWYLSHQALLWDSWWPSSWQLINAVIKIRWDRMSPQEWPKVGHGAAK